MQLPSVSVVVVSHGRPAHLKLCLFSLAQQFHRPFELVVVTDGHSAGVIEDLGWNGAVKQQIFDDRNISAARNTGLGVAAGEVVAFIDDDAAAEPTWLGRLIAPLRDPAVVASTGFVRGRNGICFQSKGARITATAQTVPFEISGEDTQVLEADHAGAIKTVGTNCAFRAEPLAQAGGFDERIRFYLDESDVNLRLRNFGKVAIVPLAQVHHAFAAGYQRTANRVPLKFNDIAESTAWFLRRHAPGHLQAGWEELESEQRERLQRHMLRGRLGTRAARLLMQDLASGWAAGLQGRDPDALPPLAHATKAFLPFDGAPSPERSTLKIQPLTIRMERVSEYAFKERQVGSVFSLNASARPLRVSYRAPGVWYHSGGIWGRVSRRANRLNFSTFERFLAKETKRVEKLRAFTDIQSCNHIRSVP